MSIKRTLHVACPHCKKIQVTRRGEFMLQFSPCYCKPVPGPPTPPRLYRKSDVIVVRE